MVSNGVSQADFEILFDTLEAQKKSAPADASTSVAPGLTTDKEWLMETLSADQSEDRKDSLKRIARTHLELAKEHFDKAKQLRTYYATLGRSYGLTNREIGEALGITEARARQLVAGDA